MARVFIHDAYVSFNIVSNEDVAVAPDQHLHKTGAALGGEGRGGWDESRTERGRVREIIPGGRMGDGSL